MTTTRPATVPFGHVQGYAPGGIPAYSNKHDMFFSGERHVDGKVFMGFKYQCVEFARRWLFHRKGLLLPDIGTAAQILTDMRTVKDAGTAASVRMVAVLNGGADKPVEDSLLIFPVSSQSPWGHVAVITHVGDNEIYVADQNYHFQKWSSDKGLRLSLLHENGKWRVIDDSDANPKLHLEASGWMTFPDTPNRKECTTAPEVHPSLYFPDPEPMKWERITFKPTKNEPNWLDVTNRSEKLFVEEFGMDVSRSRLDEQEASYYLMNMEMYMRCVSYGVQLHEIFVEATEEVLKDDAKLEQFGIPQKFWGRVRRSFEKQRDVILTGRFDFAFNNKTKTIKCFEYNADSASTLLECGRIQTKWGASIGLDESTNTSCAATYLESMLRRAWSRTRVEGRIHFCVDDDREEQYTAMMCLENAEAVGLEGKLCVMFDEFHFDEQGTIRDRDNVAVTTIWKTWMWETAITDYEAAQKERGPNWKPSPADKVRLCDLILSENEDITVFEPIWKLIPSNKAILPIIYKNHPEHPAILRSEYQLSKELEQSGYARKPIVGRGGCNVQVVSSSGDLLATEADGDYADRGMVYQELFPLEKNEGYYAILGGWMVGDGFGGIGVREDKTMITSSTSPFSAARMKPFPEPPDGE